MEKDLTRLLIETTIRRALKQGEASPERETRNLVDLGLNFSHGRFQTRILSAAQKMLQNEKSAYYTLIKDVLTHIDRERLLTFGVNLGYEGCTKGAKVIRQTEAEGGFNVPWALTLQISAAKLAAQPKAYAGIFRQSAQLGIHTYLLFSKEDMCPLFPTLAAQETSAFILCPRARQITEEFVAALDEAPNVMVAVRWEEGAQEACARLRVAKIPYSVLMQYTESDKTRILDGSWVASVLPAHPACAFLLAASSCTEETQREIYQYVLGVREQQQHPVLLMDVKQDIMFIDKYLSDDICFVGFDAQGVLHTNDGIFEADEYNIFHRELRDILKLALKKKKALGLR